MKKLVIVLAVLLIFAVSAQAQMESGMKGEQKEQAGQGMKMDEAMMKHMMEQKMMMQDMMQMMMDMMNMQERTMKSPPAAEKKQMMKDMALMKSKMHKMMSMPADMKGTEDTQSRLTCAEQWLKKAIDLHALHIKDPKTATEASQTEMMDQMRMAYGCIAGTGPGMSGKPSKDAEPSKTGVHNH